MNNKKYCDKNYLDENHSLQKNSHLKNTKFYKFTPLTSNAQIKLIAQYVQVSLEVSFFQNIKESTP